MANTKQKQIVRIAEKSSKEAGSARLDKRKSLTLDRKIRSFTIIHIIMLKLHLFTFAFLILGFHIAYTQDDEEGAWQNSSQNPTMHIEAEITTKINVGDSRRVSTEFRPGHTINYPAVATYDQPIFGVMVSASKRIFPGVYAGIGTGINALFAERHPVYSNTDYNKVLVPVFARIKYLHFIMSGFSGLVEGNIGYQFIGDNFGAVGALGRFTVYEEKGGLLVGGNLGVDKVLFSKTSLFLKVGYELNVSNIIFQADWDNPTEDGLFEFRSRYKLLCFAVGLRF